MGDARKNNESVVATAYPTFPIPLVRTQDKARPCSRHVHNLGTERTGISVEMASRARMRLQRQQSYLQCRTVQRHICAGSNWPNTNVLPASGSGPSWAPPDSGKRGSTVPQGQLCPVQCSIACVKTLRGHRIAVDRARVRDSVQRLDQIHVRHDCQQQTRT